MIRLVRSGVVGDAQQFLDVLGDDRHAQPK
jgi:hypothetical protein